MYPKSLRVNQKHVLEALLWLKKHNPHYSDTSIKESNLDWMQGEEEVSIATNAEKFQTKNLKHIRIILVKNLNMYHHQPNKMILIVMTLHLQQCMQISLIPCQVETMQT